MDNLQADIYIMALPLGGKGPINCRNCGICMDILLRRSLYYGIIILMCHSEPELKRMVDPRRSPLSTHLKGPPDKNAWRHEQFSKPCIRA